MSAVNNVFNRYTLHKTLLGPRLPIALALTIVVFLNIDPSWFWPGPGVTIVGMLLPLWLLGRIRTSVLQARSAPPSQAAPLRQGTLRVLPFGELQTPTRLCQPGGVHRSLQRLLPDGVPGIAA